MSWFDTALVQLARVPPEVTVKNVSAQIAREFYGFGPRGQVRCLIRGQLIVHLAPLTGSQALADLAANPAGQVVLHYNQLLLVQRYRPRLAELTARGLGNRLLGLYADFDFTAGVTLGVALLARPVGPPPGQAPAGLAAAVRGALGLATAAPVWLAPDLLYAVAGVPPGAPAASPTGRFRDLIAVRRWRRRRDQWAAALREACRAHGRVASAVFVAGDGERLVAGAVLDRPG